MTRAEAKASLVMAFPDRHVLLQCEDWSHRRHDGTRYNTFEYKVSLLPGFHGNECSTFTAATLSDLLAKVREVNFVVPLPTEVEKDRDFEPQAASSAF